MLDQYDRLQAACEWATQYPTNLIRTKTLSHILRLYQARLLENEKRIFGAKSQYHAIYLLEAYDGDTVYSQTCCKNIETVKAHLQKNRKDPRCRHVFIQAEDSRSPLDCSRPMLEYLLSFHQVSPSFLELVFSFGKGIQPEDFHYTSFQNESYLDKADAAVYAIYKLGRSGREIRQSYNLWSIEESHSGMHSWNIRQTVVYHSFDLDAGRAFWINIKANDIMKSRTTEETASSIRLCPHTISDPSRCFAATLTTHLIHFEWCRGNWRQYLCSLRKRLDEILRKVSGAPVERVERALAVDGNALIQPLKSGSTPPSRANTFGSEGGILSRQGTGLSTGQKLSYASPSGPTKGVGSSASAMDSSPRQNRLPAVQERTVTTEPDAFAVLDQFSIEELQRLHRIGSKLQEASLIIKLNMDVLLEITQSYDNLLKDDRFPENVRSECSTAILEFFQQAQCIIKELDKEKQRITTLVHMMESGKTMFETILQFRNVETNKLFTLHAHLSSRRSEQMTQEMRKSTMEMELMTKSMQKVAEKTERETTSMHIITFVTLVFLPGTFIATFFGSGLFQWDQNNPDQAYPAWKGEYFSLFAKICFPLMAGTILVWFGAYWCATKSHTKAGDGNFDEEAQLLGSYEYESAPKSKA